MKARALIIEDRSEIADLYALALEKIDLEVFIAFNLADAYEILSRIPPPDIVFLDLGLSLKENAEFTVRQIAFIKSFNPDMTVIVVSGLLTPDLIEIATLQGAATVKEKLNMTQQVDTWRTVDEALVKATEAAKGRLAGPMALLRQLAHSMKMTLLLLCCIPFLSGCTTVSEDGKSVFQTSSDILYVEILTPRGIRVVMHRIDNSKVHKTIGINLIQGGASISTALATGGIVK